MDGIDDYIWQRRIHQGVRFQKGEVPFPQSVKIGLAFNAAVERKEKLDPSLLTNAVVLELSDFAKRVTKSEKYFLFEMLEFNFELGVDLDNDAQCYAYANRVHNKANRLKEQMKCKPHKWPQPFLLPDQEAITRFTESEKAKGYFPKRNKTMDISVLFNGSRNNQPLDNQMTESNGAASSAFMIKKQGVKLKGDAYPFCKELGVTLTFQPEGEPRQKLDPNLVTVGVMIELLDFSRILCGSYVWIVYDLVKHNFGVELDKLQLRAQISKLMEQKYACPTAEERDAFQNEPFKVQPKKPEQNQRKRKRSDEGHKEIETQISERRESLRKKDNVSKDICQDGDLSYMCPVDFDMEMQSGTEAKPENIEFKTCLSEAAAEMSAVSVDVKQEEEEVIVSPAQPQINDLDSSLFHVHPNNTTLEPVESQNEDINVKTLKQKLWMRRATRSRQILKSSKVTDLFSHCREICLDFNVGSGNKQKLDLQLLTNYVLWEVYRFASFLKRSSNHFLVEIMELNFNFTLHNELLERNFVSYMMTKEKHLQDHPARWETEFLSSPFRFPEVYNMVHVTSDFQAETDHQPESDSQDMENMDSHPYCHQIGLDLWTAEQRPADQKLNLSVLTKGAVLEIFSFIQELCGEVRMTVNDILEHNFDVDLQSGTTEAAKVIKRWYLTQRQMMKTQYKSPKISRWLNSVVLLNGHSQLKPRSARTDKRQKVIETEDLEPDRNMEPSNEHVKKPVSYDICKEIGLDLNISSRSQTKTKLDLGVLTRGALLEMHHYVEQNSKRYVPALYEILEYNFDLSSQKHRKVEFAWFFASQVITIAAKNGRKGDYLNKVFELPFDVSQSSQIVCKEEPEDGFSELDLHDNSDIVFVRELKPVDIEVEIE